MAAPTNLPATESKFVNSEMLYFIQNKCRVLPFDSIVTICSDFYTTSEFEDARGIVAEHLSSTRRVTKHNGAEDVKRKKTAQDLVKLCLEPTVQLPTFYSVDMSRVPAVGVEHVDVSMLLQEVSALRAEVRSMAVIRNEISAIRDTLSASPPATVGTHITVGVPDGRPDALENAGTSFAALASDLQHTGISQPPKRVKPRSAPVVGRAVSSKVRSVVTMRDIDIFVSRLHPDTDVSDMKDCIADILGSDLKDKIQVTKLISKYEELYSSFHVNVKVKVSDFKNVLDVLNNAESWPEGALVRRYFRPKNG